jgi:hypothetical protein
MINFIKKSTFFCLIIAILFIVKFIIFIIIYNYEANQLDPVNNVKFAFFGDSHVERNIKNSAELRNYGKSAEPLLFSCVKASSFCTKNKQANIVFSFDNLSLNHIEKLTHGNEMFFIKYLPRLDLHENLSLLLECPEKWLKSFISIGFHGKYPLMMESGYSPMKFDSFHKSTNQIKQISLVKAYEDINIRALLQFLSVHKNRTVYLVRMPLYLKEISLNDFQNSEKIFQTIKLSIVKHNRNVIFIDMKDVFADRKNLFYDWDHLNSNGADTFQNLLKIQLEKF